MRLNTPLKFPNLRPSSTGRRLPSSFEAYFWQLGSHDGSFLKDPLLILGDFFPNVFNPNMLIYKCKYSHFNFIKNEHVGDTLIHIRSFQGHLSNVMDF